MTEQSATLNMSEPTFPKGTFTYTVGDASPIVELDGHGKLTVTLEGEVIVFGSYKIIGDVFEVVDEGGPFSNPEFGIGKYKWNLAGRTLTFSIIDYQSKSRLKSFTVSWHKVD